MSAGAVWAVVVGLALGTAVIRSAGPVLLGGRVLPARTVAVVALFAPAVLAALVVTQAFGQDGELELDPARLAGIVAGGVALALRAPLLVAVAAAAGMAALLRSFG